MIATQRRRRPGLTLLELILVLIILVTLAGIVLPMFPNVLDITRSSSGASSIHEVVKAVDTFHLLDPQNRHPDGWDSLTDGTALVPYLPNNGNGPGGGKVVAGTLTEAEIAALRTLGITSVHLMRAAPPEPPVLEPFSPTFNPYLNALTSPTLLAESTALAILNSTPEALNVIERMGVLPNASSKYVLFGLGRRCTVVGKTMREAPTMAVPDNPELVYARYVLIYEISPDLRARLIGGGALRADDVDGTAQHIQQYHKSRWTD